MFLDILCIATPDYQFLNEEIHFIRPILLPIDVSELAEDSRKYNLGLLTHSIQKS